MHQQGPAVCTSKVAFLHLCGVGAVYVAVVGRERHLHLLRLRRSPVPHLPTPSHSFPFLTCPHHPRPASPQRSHPFACLRGPLVLPPWGPSVTSTTRLPATALPHPTAATPLHSARLHAPYPPTHAGASSGGAGDQGGSHDRRARAARRTRAACRPAGPAAAGPAGPAQARRTGAGKVVTLTAPALNRQGPRGQGPGHGDRGLHLHHGSGGADGEDGAGAGREDSAELADAEHAEVGHGEGACEQIKLYG